MGEGNSSGVACSYGVQTGSRISQIITPCLPCKKDNVLIFKSDPNESANEYENSLQMHTLWTSAEYDVTLGRIAQELESSIETGSLSYAPKLAVMNLPDSNVPPDLTLDAQHDLTNPLVVDNYSVNDEQVYV